MRQQPGKKWLVGWLISWLVLVGCGSAQPTPTLAPTMAPPPTPSIAPAPNPTVAAHRLTPTPFATRFLSWRTVTLQADQSFDFRQETMGTFTEGDMYFVAFNSSQGTACFWANNTNQVGGRDLGARPLTALTESPLSRESYSGQCVPVIRGHMYVYGISGDERLAVFRIADSGLDWVALNYVLRK